VTAPLLPRGGTAVPAAAGPGAAECGRGVPDVPVIPEAESLGLLAVGLAMLGALAT
jgi:hypothetical protein